jgi:4-amino-4-deoxy-L-arabinose transferase-like glycosyltransferase
MFALGRLIYQSLKVIQLFCSTHPAAFFVAASAAYWCVRRFLPHGSGRLHRKDLAAGLAAIPSFLILIFAFVYLISPVINDYVEPQIMAVSYRASFEHGQLYQASNAPDVITEPYGPIAYLAQSPAFRVFGGNLFAGKLIGVVAFIASFVFIYRSARALASRSESIIAMGLVSLVLLKFVNTAFWDRPDPLLLLCVAIPTWMIATGRTRFIFLVVGVTFALAVNLKITGVIYFLPTFSLLPYRGESRKILAGLLAAVAILVLPFLFPSVSFINYLASLNITVHHGLLYDEFLDCAGLAALLMVPVMWSAWRQYKTGQSLSRRQIAYLGALFVASAAICVVGAKPGAGSHHLIPFLGLLPHAYFSFRPSGIATSVVRAPASFCVPLALTLLLIAEPHVRNAIAEFPLQLRDGARAVDEIKSILHDYPGQSIEMGYGQSLYTPSTYFRILLIFAGNPYSLDPAPVQDMHSAGRPLPSGIVAMFDRCRTEIWLIPKGQEPFSVRDSSNNSYLFDGDFRTAFTRHYQRSESREFFEVWRCTSFER